MTEMSREDIAKRLDEIVIAFELPLEDLAAIGYGADALRELEELEKWAEAWKTHHEKWKNWPLIMEYQIILDAIRGDRKWPVKEEGE